ncbi:maleylpyruvate isomerase family mycothiol-dependent enzyme [Streptomyces sp. NPDC001787]|uniref:maleylpyruvate isomerase family mycothiol-dependent enzyme n=1 Tax=Streptomyces sp. NPDC001787 TaxID=3154523 RepID=UPI003328220D
MAALGYDRYCDELRVQTALLRSSVEGADMTAPVAACPGWTLGQLLRHVGSTHHWAATVVRTRATGPVPEDLVNDVSGYADAEPAAMDAWLAEGTALLVDALRTAGPTARVWTPGPGGSTLFWARRMLHEAVVHRADAYRTAGAEFTLDEDIAVDGIDEWMGFGAVPEVIAPRPGVPPLLGPGRTLRFHGVGATPGAAVEWLVDLTGDRVLSRRTDERDGGRGGVSGGIGGRVSGGGGVSGGDDEREDRHEDRRAAVTVRATMSDLLLLLYRRRTPTGTGIGIDGDAGLLDLWVERSGFWLRE